jgi:hypothetical protein
LPALAYIVRPVGHRGSYSPSLRRSGGVSRGRAWARDYTVICVNNPRLASSQQYVLIW